MKGPFAGGADMLVVYGGLFTCCSPLITCACIGHANTNHKNSGMSELFDLRSFGTQGTATSQNHANVPPSPSPCVRVAWCDTQMSSPPAGSMQDDECPEAPAFLAAAKENIPFGFGTALGQTSPSRISGIRARRRARRTRSHKYVYARPVSKPAQLHTVPPRTSPRSLTRMKSDQTAGFPLESPKNRQEPEPEREPDQEPNPTPTPIPPSKNGQLCPSSDDSFSRIFDESPLDAAAIDEIACRQGW